MTMIAVGQGLRGLANRGMAEVARADSVLAQQRMAQKAREDAAESSTLGTGAGIGGMVGATKMAEAGRTATEAVGALNNSIQGLGTAGTSGGGLTFTPAVAGAETLTGEAASMAIESAAGMADAGAALSATGTGAAAGTTGAAAGATGAATGAASTATAAAASTGPMAALSTLAAPIAIGLGVAFLLNKLFD